MAKQASSSKQGGKNAMFIFAYFLTWLSGLIVFVISGKGDNRMKFHGLQAVFLGVIMAILFFIPFISIINILLWLYGLYIGWQAYEGNDISIPVIGDYAKQYSK